MNIYKNYLELLKKQKDIASQIVDAQCAIYSAHKPVFDEKDTGTVGVEDNGYKIKVVKKMTASVDQKLAAVVGIGFKKTFAYSATEYNKLSPVDQKRVDECITTKPGKPSFSVEAIDAD